MKNALDGNFPSAKGTVRKRMAIESVQPTETHAGQTSRRFRFLGGFPLACWARSGKMNSLPQMVERESLGMAWTMPLSSTTTYTD
ncbi:hypothetical protein [Novipirellula artificiosorum]|nr:hypothetical protein [Novipirellula artificiosorum]